MTKQKKNNRKNSKEQKFAIEKVEIPDKDYPLLKEICSRLEEFLRYADELNRLYTNLYKLSRLFGKSFSGFKKWASTLEKWAFKEAFNQDKPEILHIVSEDGDDPTRLQLLDLISQIDDVIASLQEVQIKIENTILNIETFRKVNKIRQKQVLDKWLQHLTECLSFIWRIEDSKEIKDGYKLSVLWRDDHPVYTSLVKVYDLLIRKYGALRYEHNS